MNEVYLSHGSLYDYQLMPFFNMAAKCGFNGVEIIVGRNEEMSNISYMKKLSADFKIRVKVLHCPFNSWQSDLWPKKPHEKLIRTVEMAYELGAGVVVAHTALSEDREYKDWLINELGGFQSKHPQVKIGIENMPRRYVLFGKLGRVFFNYKKLPFKIRRKIIYDIAAHLPKYNKFAPIELDDFTNSLNSVELLNKFEYVTIDTTHLGTWNCAPHEYLDQITTGIAHVHLSNYKISLEHRTIDDGIMDLAKFLSKLRKRNYGGGITIETDPHSFENHRSFAITSKKLIADIEFIRSSFNN